MKRKGRDDGAAPFPIFDDDEDYFIVGMTNSAPSLTPARAPAAEGEDAQARKPSGYFIVGMTNSAPSLTPLGQREVTVLVLV